MTKISKTEYNMKATNHLKTNHAIYVCKLGQPHLVSWHRLGPEITVWLCMLIDIITFPLLPFEINSLCILRVPWGITLINPNNSCIIAFSLNQNSERNCFPYPHRNQDSWHNSEHESRNRKRTCIFFSINCPRLRMPKIPWHFTSLLACIFSSHSLGRQNTSFTAPSKRLSGCSANSEEY